MPSGGVEVGLSQYWSILFRVNTDTRFIFTFVAISPLAAKVCAFMFLEKLPICSQMKDLSPHSDQRHKPGSVMVNSRTEI